MKRPVFICILVILCGTLFFSAASVQAWCWIRDTEPTNSNCSTFTYQEPCCDGLLRTWSAAAMTFKISTVTSAALFDDIRNGFSVWNDVAMSVFTFIDGGTTSKVLYGQDGTNMIANDPYFCTHYFQMCGQGYLAFSYTITTSGYAIESDIVMNAQEYPWGDGTGGTINTLAVVAHEAGHNAGVTHPGSACQQSGSHGCGPQVPDATMYFRYSDGQDATDKTSLELDDVASLVYGYPRATFRVQVVDYKGDPVSGASVGLVGTAVPVNGTSIETGGSVVGDIDASLMGDEVESATYVRASPFDDTDASGYTNYVNPIHATFQVRVTHNNRTFTKQVSVADGESTAVIKMPTPLPGILPLLLL